MPPSICSVSLRDVPTKQQTQITARRSHRAGDGLRFLLALSAGRDGESSRVTSLASSRIRICYGRRSRRRRVSSLVPLVTARRTSWSMVILISVPNPCTSARMAGNLIAEVPRN
jgi:hypothetical protein